MRKVLLFFLMSLAVPAAFSQSHEIGALVGTSFYLGDLNQKTLFDSPKLAGGLVYRYNISPRWAVKANLLFAEVEASDQSSNSNYERNLSFRSPITEISAQVEMNFFNLYNSSGKNRFSPYIFLGLSVFSFNPQANYDGKWYDLNHFGTEGQGLPGAKKDYYSLVSVAIPFGIGLKVNIGKYISCGIEWGMRYTFTDYLDDVSGEYYDNQELAITRGNIIAALADRSKDIHKAGTQRGNSKTLDWYSFAGGFITFKIGNDKQLCTVRNHYNLRKSIGKKH
ncbi:MAG: DUF6089 family protein [Bacteroidales bacterium]|jgi:hypothetical protein|nr:DUF6089 family protein [Bacteroidales bacterium]